MPTNIITAIHRNGMTGLPVVQDFAGHFHIISEWKTVIPPSIENRVYIQTISHGQFPGTDDFYSIPNELTGEPNTKYTTPSGKTLNIFFIMASQDLLSGGPQTRGPEMSMIGAYMHGIRVMCIPFKHDMHYVLAETLQFPTGAEIEIKVRPCSVRTRVAILAGGFLMEDNIGV